LEAVLGKTSTFFRVLLVAVLIATPAVAYLDPNATGLVTQILGPVLVVAAAGLTFLRKQLGALVHRVAGRLSYSKK
jgi:hypothetical protein